MSKTNNTVGRVIPGRLFPSFSFPVTGLAFLAALLASSLTALAGWATWTRLSPFGFELWSAHLSHWSMGHFFWDGLMFILLAGLIEKEDRKLLLTLLLVTPPVILLSVWGFGDHLTYRGLSGLDSALYGAAVILLLHHRRIHPAVGICAIAFFLGKCLFELFTGGTLFVSDLPLGISPVPLAHLVGLISGIAVGAGTFLYRQSAVAQIYRQA